MRRLTAAMTALVLVAALVTMLAAVDGISPTVSAGSTGSAPLAGLVRSQAAAEPVDIAVLAGPDREREGQGKADAGETALADLGRILFHDPGLSLTGTQSCATCHDPAHAFTDPRPGRAGLAVSLGHDGRSHGVRNTPTLSYAAETPTFQAGDGGRFKGGQFWDGRAADLEAQAGQPMLNPVEMGMPDKAAIVTALRANPGYDDWFERLFGVGALADVDRAFDGAAAALAAYQRTAEFSPYDSKYDRFLRGEEKLTDQEAFGRYVFITWNCRLCHLQRKQNITPKETFTSFEYHNIGVPPNPAALVAAGRPDYVDQGLLEHPDIDDPAQGGRFRVPTLRNIAVTAPYMHNGVFDDLRTTVVFYNKYTSSHPRWRVNPETGQPWGAAEVGDNLANYELRSGLSLDDARIDALVAFMETLTDRRYEPLLASRKRAREAADTAKATEQGRKGYDELGAATARAD